MEREIGDGSAIGRALVARRRRVATRCQQCGVAFVAYVGARYCNNACRQRAFWLRRRQAAGVRSGVVADAGNA